MAEEECCHHDVSKDPLPTVLKEGLRIGNGGDIQSLEKQRISSAYFRT